MVRMPGLLDDERRRILAFWRLLELFSPQLMPKPMSLADGSGSEQVIEWTPPGSLPWEALSSSGGRGPGAWRHLVFLGVYRFKDTYDWLRKISGEETEHTERPAGRGACVGLVLDEDGRIIPDSAVLSSSLWAVGRIAHGQIPRVEWVDEFGAAQTRLGEIINSFERARRASIEGELPPPQDADSLRELLRIVQKTWGIEGARELSMDRIVVRSQWVDDQRSEETPDPDFLNSCFRTELDAVIAELETDERPGAALRAYLTRDDELDETGWVDIADHPDAIDALTLPERLPAGRWPRDPEQSPTLRQQFVTNRALDDLAPGQGLMGINAVPGEDRTVVLRDILAGNIVERARRLASLSHPMEAFTAEEHSWKDAKGFQRVVLQLREEFCGFETVVISENDEAAAGFAAELTGREALGRPWRESADYFADIATAIRGGETAGGNRKAGGAWGMVAAWLGDRKTREAFRSEYWFDKPGPGDGEAGSVRMLGRLRDWRDGKASHQSWWLAKHDFHQAEKKVKRLTRLMIDARDAMLSHQELMERERLLRERVPEVAKELAAAESEMTANAKAEEQARRKVSETTTEHYRTLAFKPGATEFVFTLGNSAREWRKQHDVAAAELQKAEQEYQHRLERGEELRARFEKLRMEQVEMEPELEGIGAELDQLRREIKKNRRRLGENYPDEEWVGQRRELNAPWLEAELETARSELFLAAMRLHEDFLSGTAVRMVGALGTAVDVVAGRVPENLEPEKIRAAWQLFFLAVPVVATTREGFAEMFGEFGPEGLGWVVVDAADRVAPPRVLKALRVARRALTIGDSAERRTVTLPDRVLAGMADACGVSATWVPPRASAQTLSDRVARFGTTLVHGGEDGEKTWVSVPLAHSPAEARNDGGAG